MYKFSFHPFSINSMHVYLKDLNHVIWYMIQPFCETLKQHSINQTLKIISKHNKASFDEALLKYSPYLEVRAKVVFSCSIYTKPNSNFGSSELMTSHTFVNLCTILPVMCVHVSACVFRVQKGIKAKVFFCCH